MSKVIVYIHGKGGSCEESKLFEPLFPDCKVIGFDYKSKTPWEAKDEFNHYFNDLYTEYGEVTIIANSIGAYFSMLSIDARYVDKAYFISPVVDMERLIMDMMSWASVNEEMLKEKMEIPTSFGETLSWNYLQFVRNNPIDWSIPTLILYGEKDTLIPYDSVFNFSSKNGAKLTIMAGGEHWFHTKEQLDFLMIIL